mmetsp:Transcript_2944/g.5172  ORF Transcript_2944/g.5172 Transcript_2944/m.5172 type:complete len:355 (-) Transcript_2944:1213-2277(-)
MNFLGDQSDTIDAGVSTEFEDSVANTTAPAEAMNSVEETAAVAADNVEEVVGDGEAVAENAEAMMGDAEVVPGISDFSTGGAGEVGGDIDAVQDAYVSSIETPLVEAQQGMGTEPLIAEVKDSALIEAHEVVEPKAVSLEPDVEAKTASEAGVGGLLAMYKKKDDDAKEELSLAELKKRRLEQAARASSGASAAPEPVEEDAASAVAETEQKVLDANNLNTTTDTRIEDQKSMEKAAVEVSESAPFIPEAVPAEEDLPRSLSKSRSKSRKSRSSSKRLKPEVPLLTEEDLAKLREEREAAWMAEKAEYEAALIEKEKVLKDWTVKVRVAESQQRVKDRRRIARPKKNCDCSELR